MAVRDRARNAFVELSAGGFKCRDAILQWNKVDFRAQVSRRIEAGDKPSNVGSIRSEVEWHDVGVGKPQSHHTPEIGHQRVIAILGVPKVIHPVDIFIHRVMGAEGCHKRKTYSRYPEKIKEYRV